MKKNEAKPRVGGPYAHYVLFVLVLVSVFNAIDRNILSILSNEIQRDLGVGDAEMGFLYGTVFALFYAVFGIPLGRFADVWVRRSVISIGLMFWSAMTALSGLARSFPVLALLRMGVGIGEASASPAAYSLLSDYYSPRLRATVIAIYSSGLFIGGGLGLFLGGYILDTWAAAYPEAGDAPFSLKGWHVAFIVVGLPGILMAFWVRTLKEPLRGISEGLVTESKSENAGKTLTDELASILPVWSLMRLKRDGGSVARNATIALSIISICALLILLTGSVAQWSALGLGVYCIITWAQSLAVRDPVAYGMIFQAKGMRYTMLAFPSLTFFGFGVAFWIAPLLLRRFEVGAGDVGLYIGLGSAAGGIVGAILGGVLADWFKQYHPSGRLAVGFISVFGMVPLALATITADSLQSAGLFFFFYSVFNTLWTGVPPSTGADLVLPRMRAVVGAYYVLSATFIGAALGPYSVGLLSDNLAAAGMASAESLQTAIASSAMVVPVTLVLLILAWRFVPEDECNRIERARALGEQIEAAKA